MTHTTPRLVLALLVAGGAAACVDLLSPEHPPRFVYEAWTELREGDPDTVVSTVAAINVGGAAGTPGLSGYGCGLSSDMTAYADPEREGPPVWNHERYFRANFLCLAVVPRLSTIQPGDTMFYGSRAPVPAILGDSLPPGTYYFTAQAARSGELPTAALVLGGTP